MPSTLNIRECKSIKSIQTQTNDSSLPLPEDLLSEYIPRMETKIREHLGESRVSTKHWLIERKNYQCLGSEGDNLKTFHLPANRILIKSKGWRIKVEVTPPDIPATRCSYLRNDRTFSFLGLGPGLLIVAIVRQGTVWSNPEIRIPMIRLLTSVHPCDHLTLGGVTSTDLCIMSRHLEMKEFV